MKQQDFQKDLIVNQKKSQIKEICNEFINAICKEDKNIETIILIGSRSLQYNYGIAISKYSDFDLALFFKKSISLYQILLTYTRKFSDLNLKVIVHPHLECDFQSKRIKAVIVFKSFRFDLDFGHFEIDLGSTKEEIIRDNLELFVGNIYAWSTILYGEIPLKLPGVGCVDPFYSENIRKDRMTAFALTIDEILMNINNKEESPAGCITKDKYIYIIYRSLISLYFISYRLFPISFNMFFDIQLKSLKKSDLRFVDRIINVSNRLRFQYQQEHIIDIKQIKGYLMSIH